MSPTITELLALVTWFNEEIIKKIYKIEILDKTYEM